MNFHLSELRIPRFRIRDLSVTNLRKRIHARAALAVTLQVGRMAVGLVRRDNGSTHLAEAFALPITANDVLRDPEKAGAELAARLDEAGIRERRCVVCVPAAWAMAASAELPPVSIEDLRGYLELRAEREFPIAANELRLAWCTYELPDGKRRATLAAIPAKRMQAVELMLEAAGCRAVSISPGLDDCLAEGAPPAALYFFVNGNDVDVIATAGGGIAALRSLAGPDVSGATMFDPVAFCREVRITLGRLPDAVRQQIREARFGDTAASARLCRAIRPFLEPMGIACPPLPAELPEEPAGASLEPVERHLFEREVAFEFLVTQPNRWETLLKRFDSRKRRFIAGGVAAFILLPLLLFFIRSRIERSLDHEWNAMRRTVAELEETQAKLRQFRPWFEPTPQSLMILEGLTSAFPEQGDVWAKTLEISEAAKVTCGGFARNQVALMSFLDRLRSRPDVAALQVQQVRGENPVQFSVTYKWEAKNAE
jgi:hypothetical protein